ncbi:MAG: hypothetical protein H8D23_27550 [Candidatus Brocadiales bacterium]|nr:hypothetical protein [Candidatus Brocadiales bacterium]
MAPNKINPSPKKKVLRLKLLSVWYKKQPVGVKTVIIGSIGAGVFGCITTILSGVFLIGASVLPELIKNPTLSPTTQATQALSQSADSPVRIDAVISSPAEIDPCSNIKIIDHDLEPMVDPTYTLEELTRRNFFSPSEKSAVIWLNQQFIDMTITSVAPNEWVRISNKVVVKITDHTPLQLEDVYLPSCGGQGKTREFSVVVWNSLSTEFDGINRDVDFYTLQPGEFEVFNVEIGASEPGIYGLVLGVEYQYQGKTSILWSADKFYLYTPEEYRGWTYYDELEQTGNAKFNNGQYISIP